MNVLVWGASGGIGSMAVQICKAVGANAIGIISDDEKIPFVKQLGATGVLNRKKYDCFGQLPDVKDHEKYAGFIKIVEFLVKIFGTSPEKKMLILYLNIQENPLFQFLVI